MASTSQTEKYLIHNDVLLTTCGLAYLIGGNHTVLDYITEKTTPTIESFENFKLNISRRAYISSLAKCKYLHVIFPDKQSVLASEFPIETMSRLGDKYVEFLRKDGLQGLVLYPADFLNETLGRLSYDKLDTHLSDSGTLVVLARILDIIGLAAPVALREIQECINLKTKTTGDLGNKFSPPLYQESIRINPHWNHTKFNSNGTSNNGQIDIYFSPEATTDKKILIFGDSFFRLMLPHLSKIFQQVVFLRTPYYHAEMVELIRPDIVLTGNAERYLANVASDINAPAFQLYSYTHNAVSRPSPLFLNAFRTITSPSAISSKKFLNYLFNDTAQAKKIVGPSHMVRWGQHVKNGLLTRPPQESDLIGFGGAPVWSQRLLESTKKACSDDTKILLMVGDFRFGNEISLHPARDSLPLFLPNHSGINAKAIKPENDEFMLKRSLAAISAWDKTFNNKIHFIFWDLFCRQVQDRLAGRHIKAKAYNHPHWNLADIQANVSTAKLIDLSPLLKLPMHEAMRLFIDPSSHPSHIGYLMITNCFYYNTDARTSFNKAVRDVERIIFDSAAQLVRRKNTPILIFGQSVWLDTLLRYLGPSGLEKIEKIGIKIVSINPQIGHAQSVNVAAISHHSHFKVFISDDGKQPTIPLALEQLVDWSHGAASHIVWEASCAQTIINRRETPQSLHNKNYSATRTSHTIDISDSDIELGPFGYPTITGLTKVFDII
ncbi:hypothetical protein [Pseudomonas putida]|uniref:hypothetical protein n=1 Tax=Pseudomonas putida TaxID=303 RepID=UPI001F51F1DC|nr:hypothetical protein [Pseudomonas putida]MCI0910751.1 hypothetical protein [Pseudomonas putida]